MRKAQSSSSLEEIQIGPTMKLTLRKFASSVALALLLPSAVPVASAGVVTYIDLFNTFQSISTNNATVTNTVASAGALGGFRTLTLTTAGGDPPEAPPNTQVSVSSANQRFTLSTPSGALSSYEIKWGGAGGTAGLGGIDLRGGIAATNFSLVTSTLDFSLRSADQTNSFTWTFTDTFANVASFTGNFPAHSSVNPAIPYSISLASFSGSGVIDWSSINFIALSGGGLELDVQIPTPLAVNAQAIPEPGTWAAAGLLLFAAGYVRWRRSRAATTEQAPAAA